MTSLGTIRQRWVTRNLLSLPWEQLCRALDHRCVYCGHRAPALTKDHLRARSKGGGDRRNVVPACSPCNAEKGALTAQEYALWLRAQGRTPNFLLPGEWW